MSDDALARAQKACATASAYYDAADARFREAVAAPDRGRDVARALNTLLVDMNDAVIACKKQVALVTALVTRAAATKAQLDELVGVHRHLADGLASAKRTRDTLLSHLAH